MLNRNEFIKKIDAVRYESNDFEHRKLLLDTYDKLLGNNNDILNQLQNVCLDYNINRKKLEIALEFIKDELGEWAKMPPYFQINEKNYVLSVIKDMLEEDE